MTESPRIEEATKPVRHPSSWIYVAIALLVVLGGRLAQERREQNVGLVDPSKFTLQQLPGLEWNSAEGSLIIAVRSACKYCQQSLPFYSQLVNAERLSRGGRRLIFILSDDGLEAGRFLPFTKDQATQVFPGVDLRAWGITATPTILEVDRHGRAARAWEGKLPETAQRRLISLLR